MPYEPLDSPTQKRKSHDFVKDYKNFGQHEDSRRKLEELIGRGDYKLEPTSVYIWNLDKDTIFSEVMDKLQKAGHIQNYYVLGPKSDDEKVFLFLFYAKIASWKIRNVDKI